MRWKPIGSEALARISMLAGDTPDTVQSAKGKAKSSVRRAAADIINEIPHFSITKSEETDMKKTVIDTDHWVFYHTERVQIGDKKEKITLEIHIDPTDNFSEIYVMRDRDNQTLGTVIIEDLEDYSPAEIDQLDEYVEAAVGAKTKEGYEGLTASRKRVASSAIQSGAHYEVDWYEQGQTSGAPNKTTVYAESPEEAMEMVSFEEDNAYNILRAVKSSAVNSAVASQKIGDSYFDVEDMGNYFVITEYMDGEEMSSSEPLDTEEDVQKFLDLQKEIMSSSIQSASNFSALEAAKSKVKEAFSILHDAPMEASEVQKHLKNAVDAVVADAEFKQGTLTSANIQSAAMSVRVGDSLFEADEMDGYYVVTEYVDGVEMSSSVPLDTEAEVQKYFDRQKEIMSSTGGS